MISKNKLEKKGNFIALIPMITFILLYLGIGSFLTYKKVPLAFYKFPASIAALIGVLTGFIILKGSINKKIEIFIKGCSNKTIITMCLIYLFAGAFSEVSKAMGGVDSIVNLGINFVPPQFITLGIFIISAFISLATGTSVGTIAAIAPIAIPLAETAGLNLPLTLGALVGGAMFGDNLSMISDTTIAATKTQGVSMKDKFRVNINYALPAAIIASILFIIFGQPDVILEQQRYDYNLIKIIPYICVLFLALMNQNVFSVLTIGIIFSGSIGILYGDFTLLELSQIINSGFSNMFGIFLLSLITGGLAELVKHYGGIKWILNKLSKFIHSKKSAELNIGLLAAFTDLATANNTIAIIITSSIAKKISKKNLIDPRRTAAILDSFSCVIQGLIPYGAQLLIATSLTQGKVSPIEILPYSWYSYSLGIMVLISIYTPLGNHYIRKNPIKEEKIINKSKAI